MCNYFSDDSLHTCRPKLINKRRYSHTQTHALILGNHFFGSKSTRKPLYSGINPILLCSILNLSNNNYNHIYSFLHVRTYISKLYKYMIKFQYLNVHVLRIRYTITAGVIFTSATTHYTKEKPCIHIQLICI